MADRLTLDVAARSSMRKANKALRRAGSVPVHVFGHGVESQSLQAEERELRHIVHKAGLTGLIELKLDGKADNVMVRHVQRHPVTGNLIHVDLYRVRMDQKTKVRVPLTFVGDAPGVSLHDGILLHQIEAVNVEALPGDIPHSIEVDISSLAEVDAALYVRDIVVPSNVAILDDPEELVVKVQPPRKAEVEEPVAEAAAAAEAPAEAETPAAEAPAAAEEGAASSD